MRIRFPCPTDGCVALIEYEPLETCGPLMRCPRCHVDHRITLTDKLQRQQVVERCAICGGTELFVRKDFPQRLGFVVVLVFGLAAIYYFRTSVITAWAILASAVLVDLVVYSVIGRVTTCYACRAEYRRCRLNPAHEGFDLATSEKY